ncbi:MAG: DUF2914 domain-containing protein [Gammaproteobacteria bacterium]
MNNRQLLLLITILLWLLPATGFAEQDTDQSESMTEGVVRALFTTKVVEREPVNDITELTNDNEKVYFFSEQRDMAGQPITHRWEYNGKVMAEIKFDIRGPRWRIKSSKRLDPKWIGEWKVSVIDWSGEILAEKTLNYIESADKASE